MYRHLLLSLIVLLQINISWAKDITILDVLDRSVTFNAPAKRVIVGFYPEDYMAIGTEAAYDNVVGLSKYIWQARPANWEMYVEHRPSLNDIPAIGKIGSQAFSIEQVLSLKPDILLLADWQYKALGSEVRRIESAGVPVVVVDFNAQTLARHSKSTEIIGTITGQEERAAKIVKEYKANLEMIQNRLEENNLPKPKVYAEYGAAGVDEMGYTFGKNMWGAISTMAGGDNISAPYIEWWGKLNPEQVIAANPDVIIMTGYESASGSDGMIMGQGVSEKSARLRLEGFKDRLGWSNLSAIKNNRLFGAYHGACRTILDGAMIQLFAKAMYPTVFADLNPEDAYLDFYKKYLPVTPKGTFTLMPQ
ncbi:ABC transporter substrate-binding protein [Marinomonas balearica]|uniref:ABC-type Fe3+-hydroxamate transport system substrate-binding protein n=1 Tax=Marinomonas balearica TaxID=491947 RepID=A0A4R6MH04_9GAMM|nr:ABC transporter substrate-binding protein [Marinomonas balearica]TDO99439.1 ABC-type Fe3+-hydroxamate transport system substrate-binding protein [Marinomonas balearica]